MGAYFSKIGSDPYYANYERSFQRLRKDIDRLKVGLLNPALLSTNQFSRLASTVGPTTVEATNQEESRAFCGCVEHAVLRNDYPVCSLGESVQSSFQKLEDRTNGWTAALEQLSFANTGYATTRRQVYSPGACFAGISYSHRAHRCIQSTLSPSMATKDTRQASGTASQVTADQDEKDGT